MAHICVCVCVHMYVKNCIPLTLEQCRDRTNDHHTVENLHIAFLYGSPMSLFHNPGFYQPQIL